MSLEIYTASAGTGKTTKLAEILEAALLGKGVPRCRPEAVLATTFTRKAAAELRERARVQLLLNNHGAAAQELNAALIGTVNAVCGRIVSDFAMELGLSPQVRVLDEREAATALAHSLSVSCEAAERQEIYGLSRSMVEITDWKSSLHWESSVRHIVALARSNGLNAADLQVSRQLSIQTLLELFAAPAAESNSIDADLSRALDSFVRAVDLKEHTQKNTFEAVQQAKGALNQFNRGQRPPWCEWVQLAQINAGAKLRAAVEDIQAAAALHDRHPALRRDLARAVELIFDVAARALTDYQNHKRERGVIDFVDQEVLALQALEHPTIARELRHRFELVLVDEFQDTSPLQLAIFLKLAELVPRSVWVGDQKQAIYSFRGTDPALMTAAIDQLEGEDDGHGEFVDKTLSAISTRARVSVLHKSWRSRPPLVRLTSKLFARAFALHDIPPERTEITAGNPIDNPALGPYLEYWGLGLDKNSEKRSLPKPLAAGVQRTLRDPALRVRDRVSGEPRSVRPEDIGILCRTHTQCQDVAVQLTNLGIAVQVPRNGLMSTLEGSAAVAALQVWRMPSATLFKAELSRLLGPLTDAQAWVDAALSHPYGAAFETEPAVAALLEARAANPGADVVTCLEQAMEAINLREYCLLWGDASQRLANLDALRGYVVEYAESTPASGDPCTLAGLLYALGTLQDEGLDACALLDQEGAVAVSTWHAAKGLEWPIVVLFGMEPTPPRPTRSLGARAETPEGPINLQAPLLGRWIRYWCTPYRGGSTKTPFYERLTEHPLSQNARVQQDREELRLLYVGWTRARDRLVLACHDFKTHLLDGMLRHLKDANGCMITVPSGAPVTWADETCDVVTRLLEGEPPAFTRPEPGQGYMPCGSRAHPSATLLPSQVVGTAAVMGVDTLGPRLITTGAFDVTAVGHAMHAFLAADDPAYEPAARHAMAVELGQAWGVSAAIPPEHYVEAGNRLRSWAAGRWQVQSWLREVPMHRSLAGGTRLGGRADLVLEMSEGFVLVDHKTFPGSVEEARARVPEYAGQLAAYRSVIVAATQKRVLGCFIHLPLAGAVMELAVDDAVGDGLR